MLILGLCEFPNPFSFISDSPYEAQWRVMLLCAVSLLVMFVLLLLRSAPRFLVITSGMLSGIAFALTVVDWGQVSVRLVCAGIWNAPASLQQAAAASFNRLTNLEEAGLLVLILTVPVLVFDFFAVIMRPRTQNTATRI